MRRIVLLASLIVVLRCAGPGPEPVPAPEPVIGSPAAAEERVIGTVVVNASALNVRSEPSTDAAVVTQAKKGQSLGVLQENESWTRVRLENGETGWVASRFVVKPGAKTAKKSKKGCPPDSDFAFIETPTLVFSDSGAHGTVVVDAHVNTGGKVTSTKLISNATGDESLAFLAEKEIRSATFSPPIRGCAPRAFIFTYRRTY